MIDLEIYHKIKELRLKGMKVKGIISECEISLFDYHKFSHLKEHEFLKIYSKYKENDIENYREFVVSELFQDITLTRAFKEYVEKVGFTVELCHKYNPDGKGKVENAVKNIKRKFLDGRVLNSIDSLNSKCIEWLDNIGNNIVNYTTKKTPKEMFIEERKYLQKVKEYDMIIFLS